MSENVNILYDSGILVNWNNKNASRSGIFNVALNIIKQMVKCKDINVTLYCDETDLKTMQKFSKHFLNDYNVSYLTKNNCEWNYIKKQYLYYNLKKRHAKKNNNKSAKRYYHILKFIASLFYNPFKFVYNAKLKSKLKSYNCFFSPMYVAPPEIQKIKSIKKYTIIHDIIPIVLKDYNFNMKKSWFGDLFYSINNEDFYFTVSEYTKNDLLKYCPQVNPEHVTTTLLACDGKFKPADLLTIAKVKKKYNIPTDKKYVFSLCTLEPRKNLIRAVKTFIEFIKKNNIDDMYFVLGGGHWENFINQMEQEIENLGEYKSKIIKAGYVADEDLPALYSGAEWFVYTSKYEGFGLPPLEAMSSGCPVITSNNTSLPEVVGNVGIMIDWDSDEQHITAYEKYYYNPKLRDENRKKGLERAKQFSWEKCASKIIEEIRK